MKKSQLPAIFITILAVSCASMFSQEKASLKKVGNDLNAKIKTIESWYDAANDPEYLGGYAVAFIKDGKVWLKKTYGRANEEYRIPFTGRTVFDFASIAKQFTGFAIAKLAVEGKLSLDDPIRKYLPEFPDLGQPITIRQLLNHTSGLRDWYALMRLAGRLGNDIISHDWISKLISRQRGLNFRPGDKQAYSNTGYFLLAEIVARITGKSFREWTKENIFAPLGMSATFFLDNDAEIIPESASSYRGKMKFTDNLSAPGSSSLWSSLDDMIKWLVNLDTHSVGGEEVFRLMMSPAYLSDGKLVHYNFGLQKEPFAGRVAFTHDGGWGGFSSVMAYFPEEHLSMIFFSNRAPSGIDLWQKSLNLLLDIALAKNDEESMPNANRAKAEIDTSIYDRYVGEYAMKAPSEDRSYYYARVDVKDGNLIFDSPLYRNNRLYPISKDRFFVIGNTNEYNFHQNELGICDKVTIHHDDKEYVFLQVETKVSNIKEAKEIIGEYYSDELKEPLLIYVPKDENELAIAGSMTNDHAHIYKVGDGASGFYGSDWWCSDIVFIRDENKKIVGFHITAAGNSYAANIEYNKIK